MTVTECTPQKAVASFLEVRRKTKAKIRIRYSRIRLLDTAPDTYLGPYLMGILGSWFAAKDLSEVDPDRLHDELMRVLGLYEERVSALPDLPLPERKRIAEDEEQLYRYSAPIFSAASLWSWIIILLGVEARVLRIPAEQIFSEVRGWASVKKGDRLRLWAWRQTPSGKRSIRKSDKKQAGKLHAS